MVKWKQLVYFAQYSISTKLVYHSNKHKHLKILSVSALFALDRCYLETLILKREVRSQVPWLRESQARSSVPITATEVWRNRWKWGFPVPHWRVLSLDHRTSVTAHLMTCQEPGHYLRFIHASCSPEGLTAAVSRPEISAVLLWCSAANLLLIWPQRTSWYCWVISLSMTVNA